MGTQYKGIYIRDNMVDKGTIPSEGVSPTYSPDVICYQAALMPPLDAEISYDRYINKHFLQNADNNIYIRARNNADIPLTGKVKAFCAPFNILYMPQQWIALTSCTGKNEIDLVSTVDGSTELTKDINPGKVAISQEPFYLSKLERPDIHTCMMGLVTNVDGKNYLDLPKSFKGDNELWAFLRQNPQIAYNNIKVDYLDSSFTSHLISFGNHDSTSRKHILSMDIESGLETLEGTNVLVQSANAYAPFTYEFTVDKTKMYNMPYLLPGGYTGEFKVSFRNKKYADIRAGIHFINRVINQVSDTMTPDAFIRYTQDQSIEEYSTVIGDCYIYLGKEPEDIPTAMRKSGRKIMSLQVIEVPYLL